MSTKKIHIAYADDHTAVREGIAALISLSGKISVDLQAASGEELIARLEHADSLPDVCILDINMPGRDGFWTQSELMRRWPDIKTLALTVHKEEYFITRMILGGARGYLLKSCAPSEIENAILSIHAAGYYYSEVTNKEFFDFARQHQLKPSSFTKREMEVLRHCCRDMSYSEIGDVLGISKRSVEGHRDNLFRKLKVNSRIGLVLFAIRSGIVPIEIKTDHE